MRGPLCVESDFIVRTVKLHQVRDNDLIVTGAWLKKIYCVWLSISGSLRNKITMEVFNWNINRCIYQLGSVNDDQDFYLVTQWKLPGLKVCPDSPQWWKVLMFSKIEMWNRVNAKNNPSKLEKQGKKTQIYQDLVSAERQ